ncbi:hypothetical protein RHMOL_Rhmol04G0153600 [Rhododendron molle]|uniref:Uncharacterized protein n=1 Tax=Rhododendron molle TaxID=49168 RepID=A0ACC0P212_RHOML|nr:hypothetical protein RHMOL_Rhmol04G0153600 [Rhododendron molle]
MSSPTPRLNTILTHMLAKYLSFPLKSTPTPPYSTLATISSQKINPNPSYLSPREPEVNMMAIGWAIESLLHLYKSSSESKFMPLSPLCRGFCFKFESAVLDNPEGFYDVHYPTSKYFVGFYINCVDLDDEGIDFNGNIPKEMCSLTKRKDDRHAQPIKRRSSFNKLERKGRPPDSSNWFNAVPRGASRPFRLA